MRHINILNIADGVEALSIQWGLGGRSDFKEQHDGVAEAVDAGDAIAISDPAWTHEDPLATLLSLVRHVIDDPLDLKASPVALRMLASDPSLKRAIDGTHGEAIV